MSWQKKNHPTTEVFIHLFVALQHRRSDEGLLAQVTLVLFVAVVNHLDVHIERVLPLEGGVALVALKRPLACSRGQRDTRPFAVICCRVTLNTQSSHAAKPTTNFPPGLNVQAESAKRKMFHCTKITPRNVLVWVFYLSFSRGSEVSISEELLRLLQHIIRKKKKVPHFMSLSRQTVFRLFSCSRSAD